MYIFEQNHIQYKLMDKINMLSYISDLGSKTPQTYSMLFKQGAHFLQSH